MSNLFSNYFDIIILLILISALRAVVGGWGAIMDSSTVFEFIACSGLVATHNC